MEGLRIRGQNTVWTALAERDLVATHPTPGLAKRLHLKIRLQ